MTKLNAYLELIRFHNPIGFWLLLWPGLWGLFLSDNFNISNFTIVVLGSFLTRALGCAINDLSDRNYDKNVERTKNRPLANNSLSVVEALVFTGLLGALSLFLLSQTNTYTIKLVGFLAAPMIVLYPLMKRFIAVPQIFLGATFGLSLPISYSIAEGTITNEVLFLYLGCVFWITAYDTYYALCDVDDDRKLKLNSSAIFFGVDAPKVAMTFSSLFAATILVFAYKSSSSIIAIGVIFLAYQINLQNKLSLSNKNLEAFKANSHVGLVIAILIFIEKQSEFFN
jgi:4-hydroxybenzoate polyprenyltransferase